LSDQIRTDKVKSFTELIRRKLMGKPIDLKGYPIFVASDIEPFSFGNYEVWVGNEGACSFYTKVAIIKEDGKIDDGTLKKLRDALAKVLSQE
jgi:hypothetical protein